MKLASCWKLVGVIGAMLGGFGTQYKEGGSHGARVKAPHRPESLRNRKRAVVRGFMARGVSCALQCAGSIGARARSQAAHFRHFSLNQGFVMASGNPLLHSSNFEGLAIGGERMTVNGTIGKTAIMLILVCVTAGWTWLRFDAALAVGGKDAAAAAMAAVAPFLMGGLIAGLVLALVSVFAKRFIAITAPLYAIAEGFVVGGISAIFD
ncbi:MAG: Bax inhibitor-1/YccA family membrane protein, partial [Rhodanobacter sp.]